MPSKEIWNNQQAYDRSFSFPEILEHGKYPEEVHVYAVKTVLNAIYKDALILVQAKKIGCVEWPRWVEAIRKELNSLIVENGGFDVIKFEFVPVERRNKSSTYSYYSVNAHAYAVGGLQGAADTRYDRLGRAG
jgi:hypothetical protein